MPRVPRITTLRAADLTGLSPESAERLIRELQLGTGENNQFARETNAALTELGDRVTDLEADSGSITSAFDYDESSPSQSTSSATFATLISTTFNQTRANQPVFIIISGSSYASIANVRMNLQVLYDSDWTSPVWPVWFNSGSFHLPWTFTMIAEGGATTGNKTVSLQWACHLAAGVVAMDANDSFSVTCVGL